MAEGKPLSIKGTPSPGSAAYALINGVTAQELARQVLWGCKGLAGWDAWGLDTEAMRGGWQAGEQSIHSSMQEASAWMLTGKDCMGAGRQEFMGAGVSA